MLRFTHDEEDLNKRGQQLSHQGLVLARRGKRTASFHSRKTHFICLRAPASTSRTCRMLDDGRIHVLVLRAKQPCGRDESARRCRAHATAIVAGAHCTAAAGFRRLPGPHRTPRRARARPAKRGLRSRPGRPSWRDAPPADPDQRCSLALAGLSLQRLQLQVRSPRRPAGHVALRPVCNRSRRDEIDTSV